MKRLFNKTVIWNIFDYTDSPELGFQLLEYDQIDAARLLAILLTILHPVTMIPVIIDCIRYKWI